MVFHADLPEPFGSAMIWKLETNCAFKLLKLQERQVLWSESLYRSIQYLYWILDSSQNISVLPT